MRQQRGAGLLGMLSFLVTLGLLGYVAIQVAPVFMNHWIAERAMKTALQGGSESSEEQIRSRFEQALQLNNVKDVSGRHLVVERTASGHQLTLSYSVRKPLLGPASLCLDFESAVPSR